MSKEAQSPVEEMVRSFQCCGCMLGVIPSCKNFRDESHYRGSHRCVGHKPCTLTNHGPVLLGMPRGFNRVDTQGPKVVEMWTEAPCVKDLGLDEFNIPTWAMEREGYLFIRVYKPRIDQSSVFVIKDGTMAMLAGFPGVVDVGKFWNEID